MILKYKKDEMFSNLTNNGSQIISINTRRQHHVLSNY